MIFLKLLFACHSTDWLWEANIMPKWLFFLMQNQQGLDSENIVSSRLSRQMASSQEASWILEPFMVVNYISQSTSHRLKNNLFPKIIRSEPLAWSWLGKIVLLQLPRGCFISSVSDMEQPHTILTKGGSFPSQILEQQQHTKTPVKHLLVQWVTSIQNHTTSF